MSKPIRQPLKPDEFQMELAVLAGLDPTQVRHGSLNVDIEREDGKTVARVTASVIVAVDPDEVVRLAIKHGRIHPRAEVPA